MPFDDRYRFRDRWRIEGTLETRTQLHIGDGDEVHARRRKDASASLNDEEIKDGPYVATVMRDGDGRAYLPGSSLKGSLRSWLEGRVDKAKLEALFGTETSGGIAEFWDAFAEPPGDGFSAWRQWMTGRMTSVAHRVAINRRYRKASHQKLFQGEFVPPGVRFRVRICGIGLTEEQVGVLLYALRHARDLVPDAVTFGAETGSGFGRMHWQCSAIHRLQPESVGEWLQKGGRAYEGLPVLKTDQWPAPAHPAAADAREELVFQVGLAFEGPFLVKDGDRAVSGGQDQPAFLPLRDRQGRAFLPGTSFKGALRSQFERIARTMGEAAGYPDQEEYLNAVTIQQLADLSRLKQCVASRLFGAPGWKAPLEASDFRLADGEAYIEQKQEFVAIDRFTGGSAEELKFHGQAAHFPRLEGTIRVNLARLKKTENVDRVLEILAYALRDLEEGDIVFGFGAAKGYGAVKATIQVSGPEGGLGLFKRWKG